MTLRLRPYQLSDEAAALATHDALLADNFHFLLGWRPSMTWAEFLFALENQRRGLNLTEDQVPAVQLAAVDGSRFALREMSFWPSEVGILATGSCRLIVEGATRPRSCARRSS